MSTIIARGQKQWFRGWQPVTLVASAAYPDQVLTAEDIYYVGDFDNLTVILEVTADKTDAGDTLDVLLDGSWDGVNFYNMGEFAQQLGNAGVSAGSPAVEMMQFRKGGIVADEDAILALTAVAGAGVTRPSMCPPFLRVSVLVTETNDSEFTFSVKAYVQ